MRQPLVRTELVEVPVTQYAPLPAVLTEPLPRPPMPPRNCVYVKPPLAGVPAVCALDGLLWQLEWEALGDRANDDRTTAGKVSAGANLNGRDGGKEP